MKGPLGFGLTILKKQPFSVLLQVTNRCNLKCPFCDFWPNGLPKEELRLEEHQRIAGELAEIGSFLVSVEGGEPLVRPDIAPIVAALAQAGHLPILYSNGWFMDDARSDALAEAKVHKVGISIDFPEAARHDQMRGLPGTFDRAMMAIEGLKKRLGAANVHLISVLMQENEQDLKGLLGLSKSLGIQHQFTLLSDHGFRRGKLQEAHRPSAQAMQLLPALSKEFPQLRSFQSYLAGIPTFLSGGPLPRCQAGIQSFNIDHIGQVSPCIERIDQAIGNVRNATIKELLAKLAEKDAGKGCQDCWTLCRGTAQALGQGGTLRAWLDLGRM